MPILKLSKELQLNLEELVSLVPPFGIHDAAL